MRVLTLLALCACAGRAGAVVVGIDFGGRFLKVAAIKPGSGIEMVFNEASKRSSSAAVAFNLEEERVLGDDAYNLAPRLPKRTFTYVKNLLGKGLASPAVKALLKLGYPYAFELNKTTSSLAVRQDADTTYLVEELAAFILSYAKKISEDHVGAVVRDCVITVPPFWKASERLALMRAAEIAGLNVLSLLHETTAVR
jgi:hypoxia up-regulated 1